MSQWDEIRKVWGSELVPVPLELISPQASEATRQVLSAVGLPTETPPLGAFYHDERAADPAAVGGRRYLPVGDDHGVLFAIDIDSDQLHKVYPTTPVHNRFVNSSLAQFLYCFGRFYAHLPQIQAAARAGSSTERVVNELELAFAERDAPALAEARSYWSITLGMALDGEL